MVGDGGRPSAHGFWALHVVWSLLVLLAAGALAAAELTAPCPGGGPIAFGSCDRIRPLAVATLAVAALLYVAGLTGVVVWVGGLRRRGVADARAGRDWYLVAAGVGLLATPLLAFTVVSAFR